MSKTVKILAGCLVAAAAAVAGYCGTKYASSRSRATKELTIVHFNDTHSHFEPVSSGEYAGLGGSIERAAFVDSVIKADGRENVLLLHAGDFSQGSTYFSEFGGDLEIRELNAFGYDAVTLGNHEFDNGLEDLGRRLSSLECPVVVCNFDFSPFEAGKYIKPCTIVEKAGRKIGIVGVLCRLKGMVSTDIADRVPELDMIESTQKWADYLKEEQKCDLVIALTHIGYEEHTPGDITDPVLVSRTRNIDLVVGGHSHTFLGDLPFYKNLDGKEVPVVQDGEFGVQAGIMKIRK